MGNMVPPTKLVVRNELKEVMVKDSRVRMAGAIFPTSTVLIGRTKLSKQDRAENGRTTSL